MVNNYTIYDVTVTPITPLHIGSGNTLLNEFDYTVKGNRTWRINENALLDEVYNDDPKIADQLARTPPAQLLRPSDFTAESNLFRYRLAGKPRSTDQGAQLKEQIKTVRDEAYLPGSSLKGAIRTALVWHAWAENNVRPDKRNLGRNRKFAGRKLEQDLMGRTPNHDILRALQVSDSAPAGKDAFLALNVQVVTKGGLGSPIELEAIKPDTPFQLTIKVDRQLWGEWVRENNRLRDEKNKLRLGGNTNWFNVDVDESGNATPKFLLPQLIQAHTSQQIRADLAWFKERRGAETTANILHQLANPTLQPNNCILRVGWGTGWGDKTLGSHLLADARFMEYLIQTYRLAKGRREMGDPFPKSRRAAVRAVKNWQGNTDQKPTVPLGFVLMAFKERR